MNVLVYVAVTPWFALCHQEPRKWWRSLVGAANDGRMSKSVYFWEESVSLMLWGQTNGKLYSQVQQVYHWFCIRHYAVKRNLKHLNNVKKPSLLVLVILPSRVCRQWHCLDREQSWHWFCGRISSNESSRFCCSGKSRKAQRLSSVPYCKGAAQNGRDAWWYGFLWEHCSGPIEPAPSQKNRNATFN